MIEQVKPKRIGGIFEATSGSFMSDEEIFERIKDEVFPYRIKLKATFAPKEFLSSDGLIPKLSFTKGRKFWTVMLRREMFEISKEDYEVIRKSLEMVR